MFKKLENFIPTSYRDELIHLMKYTAVDWHYRRSTVNQETIDEVSDFYTTLPCEETSQFVHAMVQDDMPISDYWQKVNPLLYFFTFATNIEIKKVIRVKSNLLLKKERHSSFINTPHVDDYASSRKVISFLYYVNDSDGDTVGFDRFLDDGVRYKDFKITERNHPKAGTAVYFPSNYYHASSCPIEYEDRIVINFVLEVEGDIEWEL